VAVVEQPGHRPADDRYADENVSVVGHADRVFVPDGWAVVAVPGGDEVAGLGEGDRHGAQYHQPPPPLDWSGWWGVRRVRARSWKAGLMSTPL
jgi:hypothetical protein